MTDLKKMIWYAKTCKFGNCSLGAAPAQPSNFQTSNIGTHEISLSWDAPTEEKNHIQSYLLFWDDNLKKVFLVLYYQPTLY